MSVAMQPMGDFEASVLARAAEARRRLRGAPVKEPPRPKPIEEEPVSRSKLPHAKIIRRKPEKRVRPATVGSRGGHSDFWTAERTEALVSMWAKGDSASTIAEFLGGGITRSAVCGKIWRIEHPDGKRSPRKKAARISVHKKANKATRSNVVKDAKPAPKAKAVVVSLPVHGVNDADLVKGWLAQNGGPRKFARGESGDVLAIKFWLRDRGYEMIYTQKSGMAVRKADSSHKPQRMNYRQLVAFVDTLRAAEGLEVIAR
jgi:hypothetical protein